MLGPRTFQRTIFEFGLRWRDLDFDARIMPFVPERLCMSKVHGADAGPDAEQVRQGRGVSSRICRS